MAKPSHPLTHSKEALERALARSASSDTRVIQQRLDKPITVKKTIKPAKTVTVNDSAISKTPEKRVIGRPIQPGQVLNPKGSRAISACSL